MLTPWLESAGVEQQISAWSERTGLDLRRLGTTAEADEIKDTAVAQPLIVALTLIAFQGLERRIGLPVDLPIAGHSVGEVAAAAMAGVLSADDAIAFAAARGRAMAAACQSEPTGMAAIMGGDSDELMAQLAEYDLTPANRNGAGQTVVAGAIAAIDRIAANPPKGTRVVPLKVAGAFHTRYMASAESALREETKRIHANNPIRPWISNADGMVIADGVQAIERLIHQVTAPVRWDLCMDRLVELRVNHTVELPPAGVLSGLVKRHLKGKIDSVVAIKSPSDIDGVVETLSSSLNGARA